MGFFRGFLSDVRGVFGDAVDVYADVFRAPYTREEIRAAEQKLAKDERDMQRIKEQLDELARLLREKREKR